MTKKTNVGLASWAKSKVGFPYWYGTCGYLATYSLLSRKSLQYPQWYTADRVNRLEKDVENHAIVQDCVGLIKGYYWTCEDGTQKYELDGRPDKGANGLFAVATEKGSISTMPEIIGVLVHLEGHVGIYIGGGWVIEARGFQYGVVPTRLKDRPWTSWFKCPYIEYVDGTLDEASEMADMETHTLFIRELAYLPGRSMAKGLDVLRVQEMLCEIGFDPGVVDGIYGPNTQAAVKAFQNDILLCESGTVDRLTWEALLDVYALEDAVNPAVYDIIINENDTVALDDPDTQ